MIKENRLRARARAQKPERAFYKENELRSRNDLMRGASMKRMSGINTLTTRALIVCFIMAGSLLSSCAQTLHVNTEKILKIPFPAHVNTIDEMIEASAFDKVEVDSGEYLQGTIKGVWFSIHVCQDGEEAYSDFEISMEYKPYKWDKRHSTLSGKDNLCAVTKRERGKEGMWVTTSSYGCWILIKKSNVFMELNEDTPMPSKVDEALNIFADKMEKHMNKT